MGLCIRVRIDSLRKNTIRQGLCIRARHNGCPTTWPEAKPNGSARFWQMWEGPDLNRFLYQGTTSQLAERYSETAALYQGTTQRVPHICPVLADVGRPGSQPVFVSGARLRSLWKDTPRQRLYIRARVHSLRTNSADGCFVSGHDFSRAVQAAKIPGLEPLRL